MHVKALYKYLLVFNLTLSVTAAQFALLSWKELHITLRFKHNITVITENN